MTKEINKVNPNKKINVGGYRLDPEGKLQEKTVGSMYSLYNKRCFHNCNLKNQIKFFSVLGFIREVWNAFIRAHGHNL